MRRAWNKPAAFNPPLTPPTGLCPKAFFLLGTALWGEDSRLSLPPKLFFVLGTALWGEREGGCSLPTTHHYLKQM